MAVWGDLGAIVAIETINTGGGGAAIVADTPCAFEIQFAQRISAHQIMGTLSAANVGMAEAAESLATARLTASMPAGFIGTARSDLELRSEFLPGVSSNDRPSAVAILSVTGRGPSAPTEWSGAPAPVIRDEPVVIQLLIAAQRDAGTIAGYLATGAAHRSLSAELLATARTTRTARAELDVTIAGETFFPTEWAGNTGSIKTIDTQAGIEWTGPPQHLSSLDRLLRSSGRRRILARAGRIRVLEGI